MTTTSNPTKNPFSNLTVDRDAEEARENKENIVEQKIISSELLSGQTSKKKKMRPEDIHKMREGQTVTNMQSMEEKAEDVSGFKEIRKRKKSDAEIVNELLSPYESFRKEITKPVRPHFLRPTGGRPPKHKYDRHSSTGRGREIPKHGAGGKTTWGNLNQIAMEESINYMAGEDFYNALDEDCIS
jgi:hypothetical protein